MPGLNHARRNALLRMGRSVGLVIGYAASGWAGALLTTGPAHAATRNRSAEQFVEVNATNALRVLGDRSLDEAHVRRAFGDLILEFADLPRISTFVLGAYAATVRRDPRLAGDWAEVFRAFAVASYADRLRAYAGRTVRATGSVERVAGQDVVVRTEITRDPATSPRIVQWRMLRSGAAWKVVDIAVVLDGNEVWLAQQQKSQFTSILGRNNGDMRALIASVRQSTAALGGQALTAP